MPVIGTRLWKASRRKLKEMQRHRKRKQNGVHATAGEDSRNSTADEYGLLSSVCSSSCCSDADDNSLISFGDLDLPDKKSKSTCESICSSELDHDSELEHELGNSTLYSTGSSTNSITVTSASPELVAQVSRLEALISNQNMELDNSDSSYNSEHESQSYYGSEDEDEDDSLANELKQLTESEQALRNELELYQSYSVLSTGTSIREDQDHTDDNDNDNTESELLEAAQVQQLQESQSQPQIIDTRSAALPLPFASKTTIDPAIPKSSTSPDGTSIYSDTNTTGGNPELSLSSCQHQHQHSCQVKQEPFQRCGNAAATTTATTTAATTSQDLAAADRNVHGEPCSERSDSDSMDDSVDASLPYQYRLQEEDLATIPEEAPLDLSSDAAAKSRVAIQGGWDWDVPLESDGSSSSSSTTDAYTEAYIDAYTDAYIDAHGDNNDYSNDSCLSDQQVDETKQAKSLPNDCAAALAHAQAVVPAKRVALLGGGEWERMRKGDFFSLLLVADDSDDSSSDPLDSNEIEEEDTVLAQPVVAAKRASVLGGGEWGMMRKGDFFMDDSDSSSDKMDNEVEKSIEGMNVTALAQPQTLPAKRAAVLGGGQWEQSLEDHLTSSDPRLNEGAKGVVEAILPLAKSKGRIDDVATIFKMDHHQCGHSRIVSYFMIAFITITLLSKAYGPVVEVIFVPKAQTTGRIDAFPLQ